jgi:hypothetical protein
MVRKARLICGLDDVGESGGLMSFRCDHSYIMQAVRCIFLGRCGCTVQFRAITVSLWRRLCLPVIDGTASSCRCLRKFPTIRPFLSQTSSFYCPSWIRLETFCSIALASNPKDPVFSRLSLLTQRPSTTPDLTF